MTFQIIWKVNHHQKDDFFYEEKHFEFQTTDLNKLSEDNLF